MPRVSVLMPVRNCSQTIVPAIRSVFLQTFRDWELNVLDDASDDGTLDKVAAFNDPRIRTFMAGPTRGISARLNQGIQVSRGEFLARMDGDDVCYPDRFERQIEFLLSHPQVDLVGACACVFRGDGMPQGKRVGPLTHADICRSPHAGFRLIHPTWFARRSFYQRFRYPDQPLAEDQELLFRAYPTAVFANVPQLLIGYREERVRLGRILRSRHALVTSIAPSLLKAHQPVSASKTVLGQTARMLLDCVAVGTGLRYRLLRHRAQPLSSDELNRWREVWAALGQPVECETTRE